MKVGATEKAGNSEIFTGTTGSMKNAFGGLLNLNRHWTHSVIHETLVDLLRSPIVPWCYAASRAYHDGRELKQG